MHGGNNTDKATVVVNGHSRIILRPDILYQNTRALSILSAIHLRLTRSITIGN